MKKTDHLLGGIAAIFVGALALHLGRGALRVEGEAVRTRGRETAQVGTSHEARRISPAPLANSRPQTPEAPTRAANSVEVVDESGAPVMEAWVRVVTLPAQGVQGPTAPRDGPSELAAGRTDAHGRFRLPEELPAVFAVHASRSGAAAIVEAFSFEDDVRLVLERAATRRIRLRDGELGLRPGRVWTRYRIGGTRLRLGWDLDGNPEGDVLELAAGGSIDQIEVPGLPTLVDRWLLLPGTAELDIDLAAVPRRLLRFTGVARRDEDEEIRVLLRHHDRTFFDRRVPLGMPIELALGERVDRLLVAITGVDFMLDGGPYWVAVPRLEPLEGRAAGADYIVPIRRSSTLAGRVLDEVGRPLPGVIVVVRPQPGTRRQGSRTKFASTDARGAWSVGGLGPGPIDLFVDHAERLLRPRSVESREVTGVTEEVTIPETGVIEPVDLVTVETATLGLTCSGADGRPIPGVRARAIGFDIEWARDVCRLSSQLKTHWGHFEGDVILTPAAYGDDEGRIELRGIPVHPDLEIEAIAPDGRRLRFALPVRPGERVERTCVLPDVNGHELKIDLFVDGVAASEGIGLDLRRSSPWHVRGSLDLHGRSSAGGVVTIEAAPSGDYDVRTTGRPREGVSYFGAHPEVIRVEEAATRTRIDLLTQRRLAFRVTGIDLDAADHVVARVRIEGLPDWADGARDRNVAESDREGGVAFKLLVPSVANVILESIRVETRTGTVRDHAILGGRVDVVDGATYSIE
ncbi:MAG: carboxypeptidase-like regulatory domain-containing protein [Planctomycetota bacterium]